MLSRLATILAISLLCACNSTPTDWSGMSTDEISAWKAADFTPAVAQQWYHAGFPAELASRWQARGFELDTATLWSDANFRPDEAHEWIVAGFDLEGAIENRNKGLTPIQKKAD
jgi:hypothetical protein